MSNIALLAVCLLVGILLRRTGRMRATTPAALGTGIPISFLTLAGWWNILERF